MFPRRVLVWLATRWVALFVIGTLPAFLPASASAATCHRWASTTGNDANNGATEAQAFRSIAKLITSLQAGQTGCLVAGQTFHEPLGSFIVDNAGGTPSAPVTIRSSAAPRATIDGAMWLKSGTHDIVFTDLNFVDSPGTPKSTMLVIHGDRVSFIENNITWPDGICVNVGQLDGQGAPLGERADDVLFERNRIY